MSDFDRNIAGVRYGGVSRVDTAVIDAGLRAYMLPALFDFLNAVADGEDQQVATDPRGDAPIEPSPFLPQLLGAERPNAVELGPITPIAPTSVIAAQPVGRQLQRAASPWRVFQSSRDRRVRRCVCLTSMAGSASCAPRWSRIAHRVWLPAGRLHDRSDRCAPTLLEQGEDRLLLGPAPGRAPGSACGLCRFNSATGTAGGLGFCRRIAFRHLRILISCDCMRRHRRSPAAARQPAG